MSTSIPWSFGPLSASLFRDPATAANSLAAIAECGAPPDLMAHLWTSLRAHWGLVDDPDEAVARLQQFIHVSRSPTSLLALFERDAQALPALLQVLSTSPTIAKLLLSDPESFDLIRASDGRPATREVLIDELVGEVRSITSTRRVALLLRQFAGREILRIAYGEFVRGLSPEKAQWQISLVHDAVLQAALEFALARTTSRRGLPQRVDKSQPRYAIVAIGNYGGQEVGYDSPLDALLLCDQIDRKNASHVDFNREVAAGIIELCGGESRPFVSMPLRFAHQPFQDEAAAAERPEPLDFFGVDDAVSYYERTNRTWQRLAFVKARLAAGDEGIGKTFLHRMQPWVYHRLLSRSEIADIRVLRRKLEKRASADASEDQLPIADVPGGRHDLELTIQFLQLLHGSDLPEVRTTNTIEAIAALSRYGCLTQQEASILAENHAKLCRLEHHLAILFDHQVTHLPRDPVTRARLAWRLGVRQASAAGRSDGAGALELGDAAKFLALLTETFEINRRIINHLMVDDASMTRAAGAGDSFGATSDVGDDAETVAIETELILDPEPDMNQFREVLRNKKFADPDGAIDRVVALSRETVSFLSPRRCRHFFAAVAPKLLQQIGQTPDPDHTLARLVAVTDSIGAKATLWELLRTNPATLTLTVRMCGLAPYLTEILIRHPGMIDELIDSLVMDRLPTAQRLDVQSQRMCESVESIVPVLRNFKASAHLMIGVRDLFDKDSVDAISAALSDASEACLRRVIEREHETLASRFGDPVDDQQQPVEMVAIALGKFGGRETNYHSDLELAMVYTADGQTARRAGGPRSTLSNRQFFNLLTQNVIRQLTGLPEGRIEEIDLPLAGGPDKEVLTVSLPVFIKPLRQGTASVWHRLTLCRARPVSGSRDSRRQVADALTQSLRQVPWRDSLLAEVWQLRQRSESTAGPGNLKRGPGGTVDVELIAAIGQLRAIADEQYVLRPGTIDSLRDQAAAGLIAASDAEVLIENYRTLRRIEAKLRLINTVQRHELPLDRNDSASTLPMRQLAALLGEEHPQAIVDRCDAIRQSNRDQLQKLLQTADAAL